MLKTQTITYYHDGIKLEGYYACKQSGDDKKPLVVVAHDWSGRNEFACKKAEALAELGYIGFALDVYGDAKVGKTKDEKMALIKPFTQDRALLLQRLMAGVTAAKATANVDMSKVGAIGFCFGGLCVLDIARSGADLKGVASFHGLLTAPEGVKPQPIKAHVLVLHGFDDPMAKPDQAIAFGDEMTRAKADWDWWFMVTPCMDLQIRSE